jgi:plastocyanin
MRRLALLALPILILVAGCGSSSSTTSSAAPATSTSSSSGGSGSGGASASGRGSASGGGSSAVRVTMKNLAFSPPAIHAKVGQTVQWTNDDSPVHNVTYVSGPKFTSSGTLNNGATFKLKLSQAGTIHYFCSIHPFMKATIVVTR